MSQVTAAVPNGVKSYLLANPYCSLPQMGCCLRTELATINLWPNPPCIHSLCHSSTKFCKDINFYLVLDTLAPFPMFQVTWLRRRCWRRRWRATPAPPPWPPLAWCWCWCWCWCWGPRSKITVAIMPRCLIHHFPLRRGEKSRLKCPKSLLKKSVEKLCGNLYRKSITTFLETTRWPWPSWSLK